MNPAIRIDTPDHQPGRILALLDAAGLDFMVERIGNRWRVETEPRGAVEGHSCTGATLTDALAQIATLLDLELDLSVVDTDETILDSCIPYTLDAPVEFAQPLPLDDPEHYRAYLATELGGTFLEELAE